MGPEGTEVSKDRGEPLGCCQKREEPKVNLVSGRCKQAPTGTAVEAMANYDSIFAQKAEGEHTEPIRKR